jgi:hypothetical protein
MPLLFYAGRTEIESSYLTIHERRTKDHWVRLSCSGENQVTGCMAESKAEENPLFST